MKMLWNKFKTASVSASKLKEINLYPCRETNGYEVLGWYNSNESFNFGQFTTEADARNFIDNLHLQIANSKEVILEQG